MKPVTPVQLYVKCKTFDKNIKTIIKYCSNCQYTCFYISEHSLKISKKSKQQLESFKTCVKFKSEKFLLFNKKLIINLKF